MNWDWNKMIASWDWHSLCLDCWPDWEKFDDKPSFVEFDCVKGSGRQSRDLAIEIDDWAKGQFYYRDWTKSGLPFVDDGEVYHSCFWFQYKADADEFQKRYQNREKMREG